MSKQFAKIHFHNDSVVEGWVQNENDANVVIETPIGSMTIDKKKIKKKESSSSETIA